MNPQTELAIEDMRLARSYIEDMGKGKGNFQSNLAFATKHLNNARAKDPTAQMEVPGPQGQPVAYSINDIAGELLFCEAVSELADDPSDQQMRHAAETLKKALQYKPYQIHYRARLADLYLDLYDREAALALAREGVRDWPTNLDARKLLDRIESAPNTKPPSWLQRNAGLFEPLGSLAFLAGVVLWIMAGFGAATGGIGFFLLISGSIAWAYGYFKGRDDLAQKYLAEELRKKEKR